MSSVELKNKDTPASNLVLICGRVQQVENKHYCDSPQLMISDRFLTDDSTDQDRRKKLLEIMIEGINSSEEKVNLTEISPLTFTALTILQASALGKSEEVTLLGLESAR